MGKDSAVMEIYGSQTNFLLYTNPLKLWNSKV